MLGAAKRGKLNVLWIALLINVVYILKLGWLVSLQQKIYFVKL